MKSHHFDDLIRSGAASRRALLAGVLAMASGWVGVSAGEAKKKHKRKTKWGQPNEFGCISVGDACQTADQCCSGICAGKRGKKQCRAHDTGTCDQQTDGLCTAVNPEQVPCNNAACNCIRTTAGSNFCNGVGRHCADCAKDADCEALGFPPGSACAPFTEGRCANACESGMVCVLPCGPQVLPS